MGNSLLDALGYVGETLDKPGAAVRGLLAGRPGQLANLLPFSDTMGLTDPEQRVSGRGLLEHYGLVDPKQEGEGFDAGDLAGIGAQIATDPMTYLLGGGGAMLGHRFARDSADAANVSRRIADLAKETYEPISQVASAGAQAAEQVAPKLALPALPTALPAPTPPFYSRLQRAIQESDANNFKTQGLVDRLLKGKIGSQGNIHPEEIEYSKLAEALEGKPTISKQDLLSHVEQNTPQIGRKVFQHHPLQAEYDALYDRVDHMPSTHPEFEALNQKLSDMATEISKTKPSIPSYEGRTLDIPGQKNYRETLLSLPDERGILAKIAEQKQRELWEAMQAQPFNPEKSAAAQKAFDEVRTKHDLSPIPYQEPHWPNMAPPNTFAHLRTSEIDLPSGKALHAHEFQSQLFQEKDKIERLGKEIADLKGKASEVMHLKFPDLEKGNYWAISEQGDIVGEGEYPAQAFQQASHRMFRDLRDDETFRLFRVGEDKPLTEPLKSSVQESAGLLSQAKAKESELSKIHQRGPHPDLPFRKDWERLAIKQLLQEAVEKNIRTVTWSKGKDVVGYTGGKLAGQEQFYDKATANLINKMFGKYGGKVTEEEIPAVAKAQGWEGVTASPAMQAVHRFDIPESLQKEIAMKGQSLWALLGALGLGGAAMEGQS